MTSRGMKCSSRLDGPPDGERRLATPDCDCNQDRCALFWKQSSAANFQKLPGGFYTESYIRQYAQAVDDADNALLDTTAVPSRHRCRAGRPGQIPEVWMDRFREVVPSALGPVPDPPLPVTRAGRLEGFNSRSAWQAKASVPLLNTLLILRGANASKPSRVGFS